MPKRPGSEVGCSRIPLVLLNLILASSRVNRSQLSGPGVSRVKFSERVFQPLARRGVERSDAVSEVVRVLVRRARLVEQHKLGREHGDAALSSERHARARERQRRVAPESETLVVDVVELKFYEVRLVRVATAPDSVKGLRQKFPLAPRSQFAVVRLLKSPAARAHVATDFELTIARDGDVNVLVRARHAPEEEVNGPAAADIPLAGQFSQERRDALDFGERHQPFPPSEVRTQQRKTSATLHACAMQPRAV